MVHDFDMENDGYRGFAYIGDAPNWSSSVRIVRAGDADMAAGGGFRKSVPGPFHNRDAAVVACRDVFVASVKTGSTGL